MRYYILPIISCIALLTSCGDDEEGTSTNNASYFNSSVGTSWQYSVEGDGLGQPVASDETLVVENESGTTFTMSSMPATPAGFMSNVLTSGDLEDLPGTLLFTGTVGVDVPDLADFSLDFNDLPLYDASAADGQNLFTGVEETLQQTVEGIPLILTYFGRVEQIETMDNITVNGTSYNNITHSRLAVVLNVAADLTITQIDLLREQDVIIVDNYWAEDVGLVQSNVLVTYDLEDINLPNVTIPIPDTASYQTDQLLEVYTPAGE